MFTAVHGLSLVVASRGHALDAVCGRLLAGASLAAGHGALGCVSSVAVVPRLLEHRLSSCDTWA